MTLYSAVFKLLISYHKDYGTTPTLPYFYSGTTQAPYISFNGTALVNYSYVQLTAVRITLSTSVQCHTDKNECCSLSEGTYRGNWYFPNGSQLLFSRSRLPIFQGRGTKKVVLYYTGTAGKSGIYHCSIETNAVNSDDFDTSTVVGETLFVGLYEASEGNSFMVLVLRVKLILLH